jgi:hypothetical protein
MTSQPLTESRGEDVLTSFLEAFPVKTYRQPEMVQASTENEADCGQRCTALFAKFDPDTSSLKTVQCSIFGDWDESCQIWPRWGSMRSGVLGADDIGAPHRRKRIWILANTPSAGLEARAGDRMGTQHRPRGDEKQLEGIHSEAGDGADDRWWEGEPGVGRMAHGVADWVDRIKCLGNGQVPAVAATAFRLLRERGSA